MLATTTAATITLTTPRPGRALVTLGGELDLAALERLCAVMAAASRRPEVVVDVAGVSFIDCCALRPLLVAGGLAAAGGGRLVLREPSPAVVALITWCHLEEELATEAVRTPRRRGSGGEQVAGLAAGAGR